MGAMKLGIEMKCLKMRSKGEEREWELMSAEVQERRGDIQIRIRRGSYPGNEHENGQHFTVHETEIMSA